MHTILLIDDDPAAHAYHRAMISMAGLDLDAVTSSYTVDEAMDYLKSVIREDQPGSWPDYIFLDLNMPVKSGYDFVDEFAQLPTKYALPEIYLVSSTRNPKDMDKVASMPMIKGFKTKFLEQEFFENLSSVESLAV